MSAVSRLTCLRGHLAKAPALGAVPSLGHQPTAGVSGAAQKVLDTRKEVKILDSYMSYLDTGVGDNAVVFLHGNPTAAYLWRNIIPHVSPVARCLAPDLLGFGRSGKIPAHSYRMVDQYRYLSAWFEAVNLPKKVTIVCHDWGSGLGFHWCNLNRDRVQSIVFMEAMIGVPKTWQDWPELVRTLYQDYRTPKGDEIVLENNYMVETLFPSSIMRKLTEEEMAEYRRPFLVPGESRRPMLTFGKEIPIGEAGPEDVVKYVQDYNAWLWKSSDVPKLYVDGVPGFFSFALRNYVTKWPNLKSVKVKGYHFLQEDSPDEIGQAIVAFLQNVYK